MIDSFKIREDILSNKHLKAGDKMVLGCIHTFYMEDDIFYGNSKFLAPFFGKTPNAITVRLQKLKKIDILRIKKGETTKLEGLYINFSHPYFTKKAV